jgi:ATP-dependent DNA helicase RecG
MTPQRESAVDPLARPLAGSGLSGLTPAVSAKLARKLGIHSVRDLLEHVPRSYIDLSKTKRIADLRIGEHATVMGTVRKVDGRYLRSRKHLLAVKITDGTGYLDAIWWNQPFRAKQFAEGVPIAIAGRVERSMGRLSIVSPFAEVLRDSGSTVHTARIIPVHPATEGVTANQIRRLVHSALQRYGARVDDPLPPELVARLGMLDRGDAVREIHFPSTDARRHAARKRLAFEELFVLQLGLALRKRRVERETVGIAQAGADLVERFLASLPFTPTAAQRRVIKEVAADMAIPRPMNRLLQGEVGSGKTVIAVAAALIAAEAGSQTAFMAPTEVLAEQHFLTVRRLLEPISQSAPAEGRLFGEGFTVELLTGSRTQQQRRRALEAAARDATVLIGTHALIQEGVDFRRLGLAIVDEQHRFGVHQRVALRAKGEATAQPDTLIMTATPIPRTLALTLYGDLDVSVLDEMPPGRLPVPTEVVATASQRLAVEETIRAEVAAGRQAFIVCPLVEESEALEAKAAESEWERIRTAVFPDLRVRLLHGRMRPADKEAVMRAMHAGEVDVLVATTVIEVGIDVPNATIMLVEDADRFGLSQLHQLRGRIGRSIHPSRCYLGTSLDPATEEERRAAVERLRAMEQTSDGFALAERDLEIRGEGQLFGRGSVEQARGAPIQAGRGDLKYASLLRDLELLQSARGEAFALVDEDPRLEAHRRLEAEVRTRFADRLDWLFAS